MLLGRSGLPEWFGGACHSQSQSGRIFECSVDFRNHQSAYGSQNTYSGHDLVRFSLVGKNNAFAHKFHKKPIPQTNSRDQPDFYIVD